MVVGVAGEEFQKDILEIQTVLLATCMKIIRCTVSVHREKVKESAKSKYETLHEPDHKPLCLHSDQSGRPAYSQMCSHTVHTNH